MRGRRRTKRATGPSRLSRPAGPARARLRAPLRLTMGGMISLSVWLYLFGDDAARTAKREDQGGALPNSRRVGPPPSNCLLCAVHERTPPSMDERQHTIFALAGLGRSRPPSHV